MDKKRGNLRNMAMVACLAGALVFSGCGQSEEDNPKENGKPSAVMNLTATAGDGQVSLTWNIPSNNGGSEITGYEVTMDNWAKKVTKTASEKSHTYTGLTNDKEYTFKVRAINANGAGVESTKNAIPTADGGGGRELTAEEKKLVGDWVWGTFVPGIWYDLGNCYEEFRGSSSYAGAYKFNADGTYQYVWVTVGTGTYDGYGITKGNWSVPSEGKLLQTNRVENWTNTVRSDWSTVNKKLENRTDYYVFKKNTKGANGVSIESDAETAASSNEILAPVYVKH